MDSEARSSFLPLLENNEDEDKENKCSKGSRYRDKPVIESSDDDFDHCKYNSHHCYIVQPSSQYHQYLPGFCIFYFSVLVGKATPKNKATPHKPLSAAKKDRSVCEGHKQLVAAHSTLASHFFFVIFSVWSI